MLSLAALREVVHEALGFLEDQDSLLALKHEELRKEIRFGLGQANFGELLDGPEVFDKLRTKVRTRSGRSK